MPNNSSVFILMGHGEYELIEVLYNRLFNIIFPCKIGHDIDGECYNDIMHELAKLSPSKLLARVADLERRELSDVVTSLHNTPMYQHYLYAADDFWKEPYINTLTKIDNKRFAKEKLWILVSREGGRLITKFISKELEKKYVNSGGLRCEFDKEQAEIDAALPRDQTTGCLSSNCLIAIMANPPALGKKIEKSSITLFARCDVIEQLKIAFVVCRTESARAGGDITESKAKVLCIFLDDQSKDLEEKYRYFTEDQYWQKQWNKIIADNHFIADNCTYNELSIAGDANCIVISCRSPHASEYD